MNIRKNKTIEPVNSLKPAQPKKEVKLINIKNINWTFIALVLVVILFFIFMFWLLLTGFHAVDSGWTYNGGLKVIRFKFILNLI